MQNNVIRIGQVFFDNLTAKELLDRLKKEGGTVFTPNVDHVVKMESDRTFREIYHQAEFKVCDSQIIYLTSKILNLPLKEKISGSDFFPQFYQEFSHDDKYTIFLLGAMSGVAEKAAININEKCGRKIVVDWYSPPFGFESDEAENQKIIDTINSSGATVLAVGLGCPKQEYWIMSNRQKLPDVKVILAIGATIDFEAGNIKRSPKIVSKLGLEWAYRLYKEPRRLWKRYLGDLVYFRIILWQLIFG